jgi:hypothetical protein
MGGTGDRCGLVLGPACQPRVIASASKLLTFSK